MRQPETEKARPGARGAHSETDLLGGGYTPDDSPILDLPSAEQAVVGASILAQVPTRRRVHEFMHNDDIADPGCRLLDSAMRRMDAEGIPVDPITLAAYIDEHQLTGGLLLRHIRSTIAAITDSAPMPAHAVWYARQVVHTSCRRTLLAVSEQIALIARNAALDELDESVGAQGRRAMAAISRAVAVVG